jgi:VanZ family protein
VPIGEYISTPERAIEHGVEYMILGFFVYLSFAQVGKSHGNRLSYTISVAMSVLYGILDEIHQNFVPGRVMSVYDVFFDTIGALIGVTACYFIWKTGNSAG